MNRQPAEDLVKIRYQDLDAGMMGTSTYIVSIELVDPTGAPGLSRFIPIATEQGRFISANAKCIADDRGAVACNTLREWMREIGAAT